MAPLEGLVAPDVSKEALAMLSDREYIRLDPDDPLHGMAELLADTEAGDLDEVAVVVAAARPAARAEQRSQDRERHEKPTISHRRRISGRGSRLWTTRAR